MTANELQVTFSLFSFVGVIGILFYITLNQEKVDNQAEMVETLEDKVDSLQNYVYELEERLNSIKTPTQDDQIKKQIIEMYEDGKEVLLIENTVNVPRAKIEMVLKFHKLQVER